MSQFLRTRVTAVTLTIAFLAGVTVSAQTDLSRGAVGLAQAPTPPAGEVVRRLSLDDAVKLALEQNLGIRIQRIDPQIQDVGVAQARSFWAPNLATTFTRNAQSQRATSALSGGATSVDNGVVSTGVEVNQLLPWGGRYTADWGNSRFTTTNLYYNYSPQLQSAVTLNYTQPLSRNFTIDQVRQQVQLSSKSRDLSNIQLQAVIVQTTRSVKNAYWDLTYARNNLTAQRQSLELAERSLRDNQRRVEVGTMAPIDIVQAQAEVAVNEQNVIVAQAAIKREEDRLRALIFDPDQPDFWQTTLEPTDAAPFQEQAVDLDAAIQRALDRRADLSQARNSLEQSDVNIRYFRNQLLPDVNASVNYISTGVGGTQLSAVDPFAIASGAAIPVRTVVADRGLGSVLGDVVQGAFPNWTVGVSIGYPLGSSTAQANLARARLQYQQAQTQLKSLRLQIVTQVREAARNVQTNQQRVRSARSSRELQERKLEAEEKKQAAGMQTYFFVFQAQRDLAQARTQEIQAIADYNKSLVDFEAVQDVPLSGGGPGVTTAGTGAIQAGGSAIIRQ
jgi:outer membrane protein TolC